MARNQTENQQEIEITVSIRTYFKLALLVLATITLVIAIKQAAAALLLIFTAFFLALALNAPVSWLGRHIPGKRRGSRVLATSLSFIIVVVVLGAFLASIVPPLVRQTQDFIRAAPGLVQDFQSQDSATGELIRKYNLQDQVDTVSDDLSGRLRSLGGGAFSTLQNVTSSAVALLTILVLAFMMLVEGPRWLAVVRSVTPRRHHQASERIGNDMYRVVKGYVNGQVILAALAAIIILPILLIMDVSYPIALVFIVFLCGLIPMVGSTIGAIIVSTIALFTGVTAALVVLAYYLLYQQIENIFIQPRIQANSTNMSPLLVFASVVIGISIGGIFGGLVAIPIAGCVRVLILEYLRRANIIHPQTAEAAVKPQA